MMEIIDLIASGRRIRSNVTKLKTDMENNEKLFLSLVEEFSAKISEIIIFEKPEFEPFLLADYKGDHFPYCKTIGGAICYSLARISFRSFEKDCKSMGDVFTSSFLNCDWLRLHGEIVDFYYYQTVVSEIGTIFTKKCLPEKSKIDIELKKIAGLHSLDFTWDL